MVPIAGHGIEAPEFLDPLLQFLLHGFEPCQQRLLRGRQGGGLRVWFRLGPLGRRRLGAIRLSGLLAAPVGGAVGGGVPEALQLPIQPEEAERHPGHVEAGDQFAAFTVGHHHTPGLQLPVHRPEEHEQLFVLEAAQPVQQHHQPLLVFRHIRRPFGQQPLHQQCRQGAGLGEGPLAQAGFAVEPHADGHAAAGDLKQRLLRSRKGAATEGHAQRAGAPVGLAGEPFHLIEGQAGFGGGAGHLVHRQTAGDAAPQLLLVDGGAGDVVGDGHDAHVDPLAAQSFGSEREVQHISGVVAEGQ